MKMRVHKAQIERKDLLYILSVVFLLSFFFIRLIYLDGDLPPNELVDYAPVDEGVYGRLALGVNHYGSVSSFINNGYHLFPETGQTIIDLFGNVLIYFSLKIFGNNYYGLRMPSVIMMLATFILIYFCFKNFEGNSNYSIKKRRFYKIVLLVLLDFNFVFYTASRVIEPTIFRLFFTALVIYLFLILKNKNKIRAFVLGVVTTFSVFLVYINNTYLYIAYILYIIYLLIKKQRKFAFENIVFGILGMMSCLVIAQLYYGLWNTDFISNTINTISAFQNNGSYSFASESNICLILLERIIKFISSNMFLYCLPLLIIPLTNLKSLGRAFRENDSGVVFLILMIVSLLLQTIVSEDYINRKSIVLLPAFVLLCYYCLINQKSNISIRFRVFQSVLCISVIVIILLYRFIFIDSAYKFPDGKDGYVILLLLILPVAIYVVMCNFRRIRRFTLCIVVMLNVVGNVFFIMKYDFKYVEFGEKEAMELLNKYDGETILGEYVNGFTLYNNIDTILTTRTDTYQLMLTGNYKYYFDYDDVEEWLKSEYPKVNLVKETVIPRTLSNQYGNSNMCVYRIELENDE